MKHSFLHDFKSSFFLWANNILANKAESFHFASGKTLPLIDDPRLSDYYCYQSNYKPWVADTSLIPNHVTGISVSGNPIGLSGMHVDYHHGRIISETNLGPSIAADFYYQEIQIELNDNNEEKIIFENKYVPNHRYYSQQTGMPTYDYLTPCVFLSVDYHENIPFSFGGEDETRIYAKAVVICEYDSHRETILGVLADTSNTVFPSISSNSFPFNEFFDVTGTYNFEDLKTGAQNEVYIIDKVKASRLSRTAQASIRENLSIGFVDFQICKLRYPRA